MGGEGSGRKPNEETIVNRLTEHREPIGDDVWIPNYSGIQPSVLKNVSTIGKWESSGSKIYYLNGNVGIGTTNPADLLHINGTTANIRLEENATTNTHARMILLNSSGSLVGVFESGRGNQKHTFVNSGNYIPNDDYLAVYNTIPQPLYFGTNNAIRMTISGSSGNVGIGTTSPTTLLQLSETGDSLAYSSSSSSSTSPWALDNATALLISNILNLDNSASYLGFSSKTTGGQTTISYIGNIAGTGTGTDLISQAMVFGFRTDGASNYNERIRIVGDTGNVGIGTTNPDTPLHVSGGAVTIFNTTAPATPTLAGAIFVSGGAAWYIGSAGTQTRLGAA